MDSPEHTIFQCPFWEEYRAELVRLLGRRPEPKDVQDFLCSPYEEELPADTGLRRRVLERFSEMSKQIMQMVEVILTKKQALERERQWN